MVKPKRRKHENPCIEELKHRLSKLVKQKDERGVCDTYVELGEEFRRVGDLETSLIYYRKAVNLAEKLESYENAAFAHRGIAEICAEPGVQENAKALLHGKKYLEAATKLGQVHHLQLAYHVLGWLYLQIYLNSHSKQTALLKKGKLWCEKSLKYLAENAATIDCDKIAVQAGQDSRSRKARLQQVLSQICDKLDLHQLALQYHNAAMAYAVRANDHDLQYRCLIAKLNFSGDQRLKTAIELVHVASNLGQQYLCDAKLMLAQEKIRLKDFAGAKWDLISMLANKDAEKLDVEEQRTFNQLLIAVYKTIERLKVAVSADRMQLKMKIYEKVADCFCEIDFHETALDFYKQMYKFASNSEEKVRALVSIAETAKDLNKYDEAYQNYIEVDALEAGMNLSSSKRGDTAICIATVASFLDSFQDDEKMKLFRKAEELTKSFSQKRNLYESWLAYLRKVNNDSCAICEVETKLSACKDEDDEEFGGSENNGVAENQPYTDDWDDRSDVQILACCAEEASRKNMEERIRQEKDKKINLYGETRLHEAARGNDIQYLKLLIKMGYNVNARDEGGWTPLHEAVGALKLKNARLLAQSGANLNLRSNEGTLSAEGERTDSGGLTPLMEACDRGATAIVNMLLQFGADVTLKNPDNWTALDFLRNAITAGMVDDEDLAEAKRLVTLLQNKLKEANVVVTSAPPPKKLLREKKPKIALTERPNIPEVTEIESDPNVENLKEYKRMMNIVGRGSTHERCNALDDELDDGVLDEMDLEDGLNEMDNMASAFDGALMVHSALPSSSSPRLITSQEVEICPQRNPVQMRLRLREVDQEDASHEYCHTTMSTLLPASTRRRKRSNRRVEFFDADVEVSEEDPPVKNPSISQPTAVFAALGSQSQNSSAASDKRDELPRSTADGEAYCSSQQIFVKIIFKSDAGSLLKTKGMPFASSSLIEDVRRRCVIELMNDMEFAKLTIMLDECELSDDTPLNLVLHGSKSIECIVHGMSKPSAKNIYVSGATTVMSDIAEALDVSKDGALKLNCMKIPPDEAICMALEALPLEVNDADFSGTVLPTEIVNVIAKRCRRFVHLSMSYCGLRSRHLRILIDDHSVCSTLERLNLNGNDLSETDSDFLTTFISVCPNLTHLSLSLCDISHCTVRPLLRQVTGLAYLRDIDLSYNSSIDNESASTLIRLCTNLQKINLSCTGVTDFVCMPEEERKLELVALALCKLTDPNNIISWLLSHCPKLNMLNLMSTDVDFSSVGQILLQRVVTEPPLLDVIVEDCERLRNNPEQFADLLKATITSKCFVRFVIDRELYNISIELLPECLKFCLKCLV